jgi:hypothetical protein
MKRIAYLALAAAILSGLFVGLAAAQSQEDTLGEYARHKKKEKQGQPAPKKTYDNDNLPRDTQISVIGPESSAPAAAAATDASAAPQGDASTEPAANPKGTPRAATPEDSPEERQKIYGEWQTKINEKKQALDLAQRELDLLQREYRLRAAAVYADVGYRLRNSAQWDKEDRQYKSQIEAKQKQADAAKQQLADLQNEARKAGVPTKMRE